METSKARRGTQSLEDRQIIDKSWDGKASYDYTLICRLNIEHNKLN